ncbi:MAG: hypothetical protein CXT67_00140 [Methanobacteriota archaeon]|nr:MAG: hypothetical protein CXT67_00140 [Euryarchaeota archaeon]
MKDSKSYCDSCWTYGINRKNIYNRTKRKDESLEEMRIRTIEEDLKDLKHIFDTYIETMGETMKEEMAITIGKAITDVIDKAYINIEKNVEEHVSSEFDKLNVKFTTQLAILNTRMFRLDTEINLLVKNFASVIKKNRLKGLEVFTKYLKQRSKKNDNT